MSNGHQTVQVISGGEVLTVPMPYAEALGKLDEWLHIIDWEAIDILLGSAAALYVPGDPLWLRVIGPPGGTKTEMLRTIAGHGDSFELGNVTPGALGGGFAKGYKVLGDMNNKRVITLDLSPIITKNKEARKQLFGMFRSVYDGSFVSAYGSDAGLVRQKSKFDWLLAATPAIEGQRNLDGELGERFIDLRPKIDRDGAVQRAFQNTSFTDQMRSELANAIGGLLDFCKASQTPQIHPDVAARIPELANLMTLLRSPVSRDRRHHVTYVPQPELGTRAVQSLTRLAKGLALIRGKQEVSWQEYLGLVRVGVDSMPSTRKALLAEYLRGKTKIDELAQATNFSVGQVSELLKDLELLRIMEGNKLTVDLDKAAITIGNPTLWPLKLGYAEAIARS